MKQKGTKPANSAHNPTVRVVLIYLLRSCPKSCPTAQFDEQGGCFTNNATADCETTRVGWKSHPVLIPPFPQLLCKALSWGKNPCESIFDGPRAVTHRG